MLFDWKNPKSWEPLIRFSKLKKRKAIEYLAVIQKHYDGILVYHGCRPTDVSVYYKDGLRIANYQILDQCARNIFLSGEFSEITEELFQEAVKKQSDNHNFNSCVILDDRKLLEMGGHYLIYGSERIFKIACNLTRNSVVDYTKVLKRFGQPTILILTLSIEQIGGSDLDQFCDVISNNIKIASRKTAIPLIDFTFLLKRNLPPTSIIDHYHPTRIIDHTRYMETYVYAEHASCDTTKHEI